MSAAPVWVEWSVWLLWNKTTITTKRCQLADKMEVRWSCRWCPEPSLLIFNRLSAPSSDFLEGATNQKTRNKQTRTQPTWGPALISEDSDVCARRQLHAVVILNKINPQLSLQAICPGLSLCLSLDGNDSAAKAWTPTQRYAESHVTITLTYCTNAASNTSP